MGMGSLKYPELHHLRAANGWVELGAFDDAVEELENLPKHLREHPDVLDVEWKIRAGQENWSDALKIAERMVESGPEQVSGWVHRSYSLHELKRTQDAMVSLQPAYKKFLGDFIIPYNLACYCCQMGDLLNAKTWLERAIKRGDRKTVKKMALCDGDLESMRAEIERL